jgi:hypothetical protein
VLAVLPGDAFLDRGGLGDPDAVPDDRPGGGLVRRAETHRPQSHVADQGNPGVPQQLQQLSTFPSGQRGT